MATLHVFNPEHDIALASNLANFTAPHAGRQLRCDLGFLPALWAGTDDVILVDHVECAEKAWMRLSKRIASMVHPHDLADLTYGLTDLSRRFVSYDRITDVGGTSALDAWGWDKALKALLLRKGVPATLLPADEQLEQVRLLSHRRTAARLLPMLHTEGTVGEAFECTEVEQVDSLLMRYGRVVAKAPWSSSGRGVRFLQQPVASGSAVSQSSMAASPHLANWLRNVISTQGSVMVEPCYHKVKDFGLEFSADGNGGIRYEGLSLFHTVNGAYVGNVLATEEAKRAVISRYISADLLDTVQQKICERLHLADYRGPFGVDMMVVRQEPAPQLRPLAGSGRQASTYLLHPCVEINLRRTMGHVALVLGQLCNPAGDDELQRVMRITFDGNHYKLKINKLR